MLCWGRDDRHFLLTRFPCAIIYEVVSNEIRILAVALGDALDTVFFLFSYPEGKSLSNASKSP
jgi:hypothetical protein